MMFVWLWRQWTLWCHLFGSEVRGNIMCVWGQWVMSFAAVSSVFDVMWVFMCVPVHLWWHVGCEMDGCWIVMSVCLLWLWHQWILQWRRRHWVMWQMGVTVRSTGGVCDFEASWRCNAVMLTVSSTGGVLTLRPLGGVMLWCWLWVQQVVCVTWRCLGGVMLWCWLWVQQVVCVTFRCLGGVMLWCWLWVQQVVCVTLRCLGSVVRVAVMLTVRSTDGVLTLRPLGSVMRVAVMLTVRSTGGVLTWKCNARGCDVDCKIDR